jgi:hypothetical protein
MQYEQLERALRKEAATISQKGAAWSAAEVSRKLEQIADQLAGIRHQHQTGIDASMGKRSGGKIDI